VVPHQRLDAGQRLELRRERLLEKPTRFRMLEPRRRSDLAQHAHRHARGNGAKEVLRLFEQAEDWDDVQVNLPEERLPPAPKAGEVYLEVRAEV